MAEARYTRRFLATLRSVLHTAGTLARPNLVALTALLVVAVAARGHRGVLPASLFALATLSERLFSVSAQLASHCTSASQRVLVTSFSANGALVLFVSAAMRLKALRLVQLSLAGSLIFNLLAVPGSVLLLCGARRQTAAFRLRALSTQALLLLLVSSAVAVPSMLTATNSAACKPGACRGVLLLSRLSSALLLLAYATWLRFVHGSHAHLFAEEAAPPGEDASPRLSRSAALGWTLLFAAACAAVCELAVNALHSAAARSLPRDFVAAVLVPVAANFGDHSAAMAHAARGACAAALAVALNAATQIALCLLPSAVLGAALHGQPLGLDLEVFEAAALLLAALIANLTLADGRGNWLKGATLVAAYVVTSASFATVAQQHTRAAAEQTHKG